MSGEDISIITQADQSKDETCQFKGQTNLIQAWLVASMDYGSSSLCDVGSASRLQPVDAIVQTITKLSDKLATECTLADRSHMGKMIP